MGVLSSEVRAWLVPDLAGALAVVDASGVPRMARIWGARLVDASDTIEILLQRSSAQPVLDALVSPRQGALNLVEVTTYRSRLFKGPSELCGHAPDAGFMERALTAMGRAFHSVGMPADSAERMRAHGEGPRLMVVVRVIVEAAFDQSPKPGAGGPIACAR